MDARAASSPPLARGSSTEILNHMSSDHESSPLASEDTSVEVLESPPGRMRCILGKLRLATVGLLAISIIVVVARNWEPIPVDAMGRKIEIPLSVLVILTFLLGALVGFLLAFFRPWRRP